MSLLKARKWRNSLVIGLSTIRRTSQVSDDLVPRLPPELCDRIIDFLHNNPRALAACCLTCRSWVHASRYHRFRQVYFTSENLAGFQRLLETTPAIARYVESVTVDFLRQKPRHGLADAQQEKAELMQQIFRQLTAVTKLRITSLYIWEDVIQLFSILSTVKVLDFPYFVLALPLMLSMMVCAFPQLEMITIPEQTLLMMDPGSSGLPVPPSSLRRLRLNLPYGVYARPISEWLVSQAISQQLQQLSVNIRIRDLDAVSERLTRSAIGMLFRDLGPSLKSLELTMSREIRLKGIHFNLAKCTNLRHIKLMASSNCACCFRHPHATNSLPTWGAAFLSRIKTHSVRTIVFYMRLHGLDDLRDLAWIEELALPLSRPEFSQLKRVTFQIAGGRYESELLRFIKREIPELYSRGILSVEAVAPWDPIGTHTAASGRRHGSKYFRRLWS